MARQWERAIVLRAGRFLAVNGPGLFVIVPILDTVAAIIDTRLRTTQFVAEQTLTKDTVPVDVDAIIFWIVVDAQRAALEVVNYGEADCLGGANLAARNDRRQRTRDAAVESQGDGRRAARHDLGGKTAQWGIDVRSVEIRDVRIPVALQDAMSRQAQAERERQARVILGAAEAEIANKFARGGAHLRRQSGRAASARHEHAVRERQGARQHDHRAEQRR